MSAAASTRRNDLWIALAIFAAVFAMRAAFVLATPDAAWPHSILYEGDAPVWARWARAIASGRAFEFDLPMRAPGVAFALAWCGAVAAPFTAVKLAWCATSAATCALLYGIVRGRASRRVALLAACAFAFSFGANELASSLNGEAPYGLLLVAIVGLSIAWSERHTLMLAGAWGALNGIALLVRPEHGVLAALLACLALLEALRRGARGATLAASSAVAIAVGLAACAPWAWRAHAAVERFNREDARPIDFERADPPWTPQARELFQTLPAFARPGNFAFLQDLRRAARDASIDADDVQAFFDRWGYFPRPLAAWTLSSSKGALDFALANHLPGDGGFSRAGLQDGRDAVAEFSLARPSHLALYNRGYEIGWRSIRGDPAAWLALVGRKLAIFWDGATLGLCASNWPYDSRLIRRPVDLAVPSRGDATWWRIAWTLALLVGALRALATVDGRMWLAVVGYKLAVTVLFYGYARQAASIAPAWCVLVALAIDAAWSATTTRAPALGRWLAVLAGAAVLALAAGDLARWRRPPRYEVRPIAPDAHIAPADEWGIGAIETFDAIELVGR